MAIKQINPAVGDALQKHNWGIVKWNFEDTMAVSTYDEDLDGIIDAAHGGTGLDTSGETGVPQIVAGTWSVPAVVATTYGGTGLDTSEKTGVPQLVAGTWSIPSVVAPTYGGTGVNTSSWTGVVIVMDGGWDVQAQLIPLRGGTGLNSSESTGVATVSGGTWSIITPLTLVLGGTGLDLSEVAKGSVLVANAAGALSVLTASTTGHVPTRQSAGTLAWQGGIDNVGLNDVGGILINGNQNCIYVR